MVERSKEYQINDERDDSPIGLKDVFQLCRGRELEKFSLAPLACSEPPFFSLVQNLLLLNIFINDFFYAIEHFWVCNFADDNAIFASSGTLNEVEKFQLIFFVFEQDHELNIEINGNVIKISDTVKLLGVTIDSELKCN